MRMEVRTNGVKEVDLSTPFWEFRSFLQLVDVALLNSVFLLPFGSFVSQMQQSLRMPIRH